MPNPDSFKTKGEYNSYMRGYRAGRRGDYRKYQREYMAKWREARKTKA